MLALKRVVLADLSVHGRLLAEGVEDRVDRIRVSWLRSVVALHLDKNAVIGAQIVIHLQTPDILVGEIPLVGAKLQRARYAGRERIGRAATAAGDWSCEVRARRARIQVENVLVEGHGLALAGCRQIVQRGSGELRAGNLRLHVGGQNDSGAFKIEEEECLVFLLGEWPSDAGRPRCSRWKTAWVRQTGC